METANKGQLHCPRLPELSARAFWLCAAAIVAVKCVLCAFQMAYTWVGGAPLDDELMFRAANAISNGEWLGAYDYLTLSKSMFFAVWLAFLHALHLPYLISGQLLWCGASLLAALAFRPWLRHAGRGRWAELVLLGVLAFNPASTAAYTLRVYRDNIFPALCLICFAGFCGALLRAVFTPESRRWPWLLAAGAGLVTGYLDREDAGLFLLPFAALVTLVLAGLTARQRHPRRLAALVLPFALLGAGILTFCGLNQQYYGVFALSDFSTGSFADAMGAMARVEAPEGYTPLVAVTKGTRELLYENVPELAPLEYWLEEDPQLQNDFRDPELDDYRAGSFYWAIRRAAQFEGLYDTAQEAEEYWASVAARINALCDDGTLPSWTGKRSSTTPPIRTEHVLPVLAESAKGALWALTFQDCQPYEALRSIGTEEDFAQWSAYLHCNFNGAAEAGKDTPYYSPYQKIVFGFLQGVRYVYAALLPLSFLYALYLQIKKIPAVFKTRKAETLLPWALLLVLLGMAALRCAMIAFVEVSSFGIGTSTMYLATVHPLLLLYAVVGILTERRSGHVHA